MTATSTETIPGLTAALALSGAEQIWAVQGGQDIRLTVDQIITLASGPAMQLVAASGTVLMPRGFYGVRTSLGAFTGSLPQLSTVTPGSYVEIADVDNNAFVNNFTVDAYAGDSIALYGATSSSFALSINNTIVRIIANTGAWRLISYGG